MSRNGVHFTRMHKQDGATNGNQPRFETPTPVIQLVFAAQMISSLVKDKSANPVTQRVRLYFELLDEALARIDESPWKEKGL